ncbi:NADH-quinone oxidoreductase subunit M [Helicobacter saguini]|uniref:NADH-quinone oxidoreductase subunit M n=1 Tax=Helicobacter saguini TaxID=1548018 RepID=A0A347VSC7_9HELI|nr:NADH-quinone oxidoreductase subunit M [Helicobacter saguini]MWV62559.1 NADH-quinone oxidoreductase subunit M [Helicobacter saguini]MWV66767.1 NADH-quinone oxidoreductase subunit M [Helicobacter saguini]MWV69118.1 NADH-quinone oxidoreductase subunit M [Helicobacter saguini]MWV71327.1 NADH-quinone oxidoreductase subunit M [Helicobacter saguini]TLD94163.1 NADH-quinone oxidoreductase subunit M [Helicobacter saguini]
MEYILTLIIATPLVATLFIFLFDDGGAKRFGRIISLIELLMVLFLWCNYDSNVVDVQFYHKFFIMESLGINYSVYVDGISLFLVILTAFIIFIACVFLKRSDDAKPFVACLLSLEGILMGLFLSSNAILFYVFWELALIPVLYMVGVWGSGNRIYIGLKFFVYTFASSLLMLMAILYMGYLCYTQIGIFSFDFFIWRSSEVIIPFETQLWLFLGFFISIMVKIPIVPLHTWLPHIYTEAPTLGSVMLSALLSKMGTFALLRFVLPIFPDACVYYMPVVSVLAVIMVVYAGIIAFKQKDIKRVIAYSSISHMGIVLLGIFSFNADGISGAIFMMVAHGITSAGLFILAGMLYYRTNTRHIADFGSVAHVMPHYAFFFALVMLSNVGLPLTIGFVGEFLSLYGFFATSPVLTALAGTTLIISASYMLYLFKNIFYNKESYINSKDSKILSSLKDLNFREYLSITPIAAAIVAFGIYPNAILNYTQVSAQQLVSSMLALSVESSSKTHLLKVNGGLIAPLNVEQFIGRDSIEFNGEEIPLNDAEKELLKQELMKELKALESKDSNNLQNLDSNILDSNDDYDIFQFKEWDFYDDFYDTQSKLDFMESKNVIASVAKQSITEEFKNKDSIKLANIESRFYHNTEYTNLDSINSRSEKSQNAMKTQNLNLENNQTKTNTRSVVGGFGGKDSMAWGGKGETSLQIQATLVPPCERVECKDSKIKENNIESSDFVNSRSETKNVDNKVDSKNFMKLVNIESRFYKNKDSIFLSPTNHPIFIEKGAKYAI